MWNCWLPGHTSASTTMVPVVVVVVKLPAWVVALALVALILMGVLAMRKGWCRVTNGGDGGAGQEDCMKLLLMGCRQITLCLVVVIYS